jgi:hypothetical protein
MHFPARTQDGRFQSGWWFSARRAMYGFGRKSLVIRQFVAGDPIAFMGK